MHSDTKAKVYSKKAAYMRIMSLMALFAIVLLAACGGDAATATPSSATPTAAASDSTTSDATGSSVTIDATLREWAVDLSQSEVAAGGVTINVTNAGSMAHNLTVKDSSGNNLGATTTFRGSDGVQTIKLELTAGTYTLYCSLPGHAQRGQSITLTVK